MLASVVYAVGALSAIAAISAAILVRCLQPLLGCLRRNFVSLPHTSAGQISPLALPEAWRNLLEAVACLQPLTESLIHALQQWTRVTFATGRLAALRR